MSVDADIRALRVHLRELAGQDGDLPEARYGLRPEPRRTGFYHGLRWLVKRLLDGVETLGIKRPDPWSPALRHGSTGPTARPLLIWAVGTDRETLRTASKGFQALVSALPGFAPVLVTDVADFGFFSRLGWLVEYLPSLPGEGPELNERKAAYFARLYRDAPALPVSAGPATDAEVEALRRHIVEGIAD